MSELEADLAHLDVPPSRLSSARPPPSPLAGNLSLPSPDDDPPVSSPMGVPRSGEDDLSFSSVHREPDSSTASAAPSFPPLDPSAFFHPQNPQSPSLEDQNLSSGPSVVLSEMSSSGGDTSHPRSAYSQASSSSNRAPAHVYQPNYPQNNPRYPQQQQGPAGGPSSFRQNRPPSHFQQPSPAGRASNGFTRPQMRPPPGVHPNAYNPPFDRSPTSPSRSAYSGGLPAFDGPEGDRSGGGGGQGWTPWSGGQPLMGGQTGGPRASLGAFYPAGSSSSAASSPGAYPPSMGGPDPRLGSPSPPSTSPIQSATSATSSRYRPSNQHQHQNLHPSYSHQPPGPYSSYQSRPPPQSYYPPPGQFYPPSPIPSSDGQPSSPMQPHTVQGPDGQTWMYFPVPVSSGFYPPAPGGGPPSETYGGGYGPGVGGYGQYGGGGSASAPSPYLGPASSVAGLPSPSPLNLHPQPFPYPPSSFQPTSPRPPPNMPYGGFHPTSPRQHPSSSPFNAPSHHPIVRKPYHPPPPPARSEHVMWVGNVASDATQDELLAFFSKSVPDGSIASIFNISRSQCCFVNFNSQEALDRGIQTFNGTPLRPDEGARSPRLVCRVRRKEDDLKAGVGGQRGRGVHTGWVKERQAAAASQMKSAAAAVEGAEDGGEDGATTTQTRHPAHQTSTSSIRTISSQASTDSSFLARNFPIRFFIMKSLTSVDLETSVQQGLWATQVHNEATLDQAYRTSREVILIFGANKTGEFFGYAKMAGAIGKSSDRRISWASREGSGSSSLHSPISPSGVRAGFSSQLAAAASSSHHPATHHQRSAPERIVEAVEDDNASPEPPLAEADPPRSVSHPAGMVLSSKAIDAANATAAATIATAAPTSSSQNNNSNSNSRFLFPAVQDSPGEISPGHEKEYASLGGGGSDMLSSPISAATTSAKAPSLLSRVLDRDGKGERSSAPGHLESRRRKSDESVLDVGEKVPTLDPADLRRLRIQDGGGGEGGVGGGEKGGGGGTTSSLPGNKPPTKEDTTDDDGVKRTDQLSSSSASASASASSKHPSSGSSGSGSSSRPAHASAPTLANLQLSTSPSSLNTSSPSAPASAPPPLRQDGGVEVWGTPFRVDWVKTTRLPFHRVRHLRNPWNQDREIKVSRDGTEVEPEVGRLLMLAWENAGSGMGMGSPPAQQGGFFVPPTSQPMPPMQQQFGVGAGVGMGGAGLGLSVPASGVGGTVGGVGGGGAGAEGGWGGYEMGGRS